MHPWIPLLVTLLALAAAGAAGAADAPDGDAAAAGTEDASEAVKSDPAAPGAEGASGAAAGDPGSPRAAAGAVRHMSPRAAARAEKQARRRARKEAARQGPLVPWPIPEGEVTDPEEQFVIGRALLLGHDENGKPYPELRNIRAANDWFEKAALQGHPKAQVNLGISYLRGRGRYGPDKGLEWIRRASEQGHPKAHLELALMYRDGRVVRRDRVRALMYVTLAAQRGSPAAQFMQSGFARRLTEADRREAQRLVVQWRTSHGYPPTGPLPPMARTGMEIDARPSEAEPGETPEPAAEGEAPPNS